MRQVHQQHVAGAEIGQEIFGAAAKPGHGLSLQPGNEVVLKGKAQILAPRFRLNDFRAFHDRLQAATDSLDFG